MRCILIYCVLLICSCQARHLDESPHTVVLKRVARQVIDMETASVLVEAAMLQQCTKNGRTEFQDDLQISFSKMRECLMRKKMFSVREEEYVNYVDNCAEDVVGAMNKCLLEDQQYLSTFFLNSAKSLISFLYRDLDLLPDLKVCLKKFVDREVQVKYHQCLMTIGSHDDLPRSLEAFCQVFIPAIDCFPKMLETYCEGTSAVKKFRQDYVAALTKYCH